MRYRKPLSILLPENHLELSSFSKISYMKSIFNTLKHKVIEIRTFTSKLCYLNNYIEVLEKFYNKIQNV